MSDVRTRPRPALKLSDADVRRIRELVASRELSQREAAERYGVDPAHVSGICTGKIRRKAGGPLSWRPNAGDFVDLSVLADLVANEAEPIHVPAEAAGRKITPHGRRLLDSLGVIVDP